MRMISSLSHSPLPFHLFFFFLFLLSLTTITESYLVNLKKIHNSTLTGTERGCAHPSQYYVTKNLQFPMCMGQSPQDLKNGMSIINLINSRGYLPTCRVLHFLLWMASEIHEKQQLLREYFVDIGANIGSCSVHIASLGFPVIAVEPVQQHVDTIQGSININPSFQIELHHIGMAAVSKAINANFGHGARNWGASEFHEVGVNESFELELQLRTLDQVLHHRNVALMKVDCEGCEWETLKGNYDLFYDHFGEQHLYFGKYNKEIFDIDRLFGSGKFSLESHVSLLHQSAKQMLQDQINPADFDQKQFLKKTTDIIAIERHLANRMRNKWLKE